MRKLIVFAALLAGCSGSSSAGSGSSGSPAITATGATSSTTGSSGATTGTSGTGATSSTSTTSGGSTSTSGTSGADCGGASDCIPLDQLCANAAQGLKNIFLLQNTQCGQPLTSDDALHLSIGLSFPHAPTDLCAADGGLVQAVAAPVVAAIQAGRMSYDGRAAFACQAAGRVDGGVVALADGGVCDEIFVSQLAAGAACQLSFECPPGMFCSPSDGQGAGSCAGTCQPLRALGQSCTENLPCVPGARCDADAGATCVTLQQAGGPCGASVDCVSGSCVSNICVVSVTVGQSCDATHSCSNSGCENGTCVRHVGNEGDACVVGSQSEVCAACLKCEANDGGAASCVRLSRLNEACVASTDCVPNEECVGLGSCALKPRPGEVCTPRFAGDVSADCLYGDSFCASADGGPGVCTLTPVGHGALCDTSDSQGCTDPNDYCSHATGHCETSPGANQPCPESACAPGLTCSSGTCVALGGANADCTQVACGAGFFCDATSHCAALLTGGASCSSDGQCASNHCGSVSRVCVQPCGDGGSSCAGCTNTGALKFLLFLSIAVVAPHRRRRRW